MKKQKIVVGITGASGSVYAKVLLRKLLALKSQIKEVGVVFSDNAKQVWVHELGKAGNGEAGKKRNGNVSDSPFHPFPDSKLFSFYDKTDFTAPFASGSSEFNTMIICPCSMGTLARIATGISNDLITRAADVMLKEKRKLILVTRDTPLSLIHIDNMRIVTLAGGIVFPASPSFYSKPKNIEQLISTVIDRVLTLCGLEIEIYRWGEKRKNSK